MDGNRDVLSDEADHRGRIKRYPTIGKTMTMPVNNGSPVADIPAGTYSGNIVITIR
jgi:hypothetical protein